MIIGSWNVNSVRARIENIKEYLKKYDDKSRWTTDVVNLFN